MGWGRGASSGRRIKSGWPLPGEGSDDWRGAGLVSLEGSYTHTYAQHDCVYKGRLEQFHPVPPRRRAMCVNHQRNVYIDDVCSVFFGIRSTPLRLPQEQPLFFTKPMDVTLCFLRRSNLELLFLQ